MKEYTAKNWKQMSEQDVIDLSNVFIRTDCGAIISLLSRPNGALMGLKFKPNQSDNWRLVKRIEYDRGKNED